MRERKKMLCTRYKIETMWKSNLKVILWVPVWIKDNDSIGGGEVDSKTTGTGAEQEDESVRLWTREPVDCFLTNVPSDTAIYSLV